DFERALVRALRSCEVLLAVVGPSWLDAENRARLHDPRDYVRREISTALGRRGARVLPVLTEGASMPRAEDLPEDLKPLALCNARPLSPSHWETDVERLVAFLKRALFWKRWVALLLVVLLVLAALLVYAQRRLAEPLPIDSSDARAGPPTAALGREELVLSRPVFDASAGLLLSRRAQLSAEGLPSEVVDVEFEEARLSPHTVEDFELDPRAAETFGEINYDTRASPDESADAYERACGTNVEVRLPPGADAPAALRFSQKRSNPGGARYRELEVTVDGAEASVQVSSVPNPHRTGPVGEEGPEPDDDGPGCRKHLRAPFVEDTRAGAFTVEAVAARGRAARFRFRPMDDARDAFKEDSSLEPFALGSPRVREDAVFGVRAAGVSVRTFDGRTTLELTAADEREPLQINALEVGSDYVRVRAGGRAFVNRDGRDASSLPERLAERWLPLSLLALAAALLLFWFLYLARSLLSV
ncbi:MAG TPA: hypothetical protein VGV38_05180, partial [Pyrinomonadaceae bacterium]|nr:hypothetical protein [Pyrinomonadaceae bacterium]